MVGVFAERLEFARSPGFRLSVLPRRNIPDYVVSLESRVDGIFLAVSRIFVGWEILGAITSKAPHPSFVENVVRSKSKVRAKGSRQRLGYVDVEHGTKKPLGRLCF